MDLADGAVPIVWPDGVSQGTGFVVPDTLLVTCSHVVQRYTVQVGGEPRPEAVRLIFQRHR
jgi:hypothetical protein